jgi:hypothetical protein
VTQFGACFIPTAINCDLSREAILRPNWKRIEARHNDAGSASIASIGDIATAAD